MTVNDQSDRMTLAAIVTRLIGTAQGKQRLEPSRDVAEDLDRLIDELAVLTHAIDKGRPILGSSGPLADAAAQLHILARRRAAHYPAISLRAHIAFYLERLTAIAVEAADAIDIR